MKKNKIIAIVGPSGSGKTSLSINLAKKINGEIISVDSRQIYKELNIGSAKPTIKEQSGIIHHMTDIVNVEENYTVADFSDNAKNIIKDIISEEKTPILVGGTGLYFRVLLQDFDLPRVAPNEKIRNDLNQKTTEELYNMLLNLDFDSAKKIHKNNKVKIIRALEVCITLGIPMSKARKKKENEFNTLWIGLNSDDREYLYERVNQRVDIMFKQGLLNEAKELFEKYGENNILLNTIGYQELYPYLKNEITLENATEQLKQNTRRYVKRQLSWFNSNKDINWFDIKINTEEEIINQIILKYKNL